MKRREFLLAAAAAPAVAVTPALASSAAEALAGPAGSLLKAEVGQLNSFRFITSPEFPSPPGPWEAANRMRRLLWRAYDSRAEWREAWRRYRRGLRRQRYEALPCQQVWARFNPNYDHDGPDVVSAKIEAKIEAAFPGYKDRWLSVMDVIETAAPTPKAIALRK